LKDPRAWEEFWVRYRGIVRTIAAKHGLGGHDVDDVAQDVFLRVSKNIERIERRRRRGAFRSWFAQVANWITRDHLRRHRRQVGRIEELPGDSDLVGQEFISDPTVSLAAEQTDLADLARLALSRLQRKFELITLQMYGLYVIDGKDARTVARFLGVTTSRVYVSKFRVTPYLRWELIRMQGAIHRDLRRAATGSDIILPLQ